MTQANGGPAFPDFKQEGMTLRDYFAAKAMNALIASGGPLRDFDFNLQNGKSVIENYAACAYIFADAMLSERAA